MATAASRGRNLSGKDGGDSESLAAAMTRVLAALRAAEDRQVADDNAEVVKQIEAADEGQILADATATLRRWVQVAERLYARVTEYGPSSSHVARFISKRMAPAIARLSASWTRTWRALKALHADAEMRRARDEQLQRAVDAYAFDAGRQRDCRTVLDAWLPSG